MCWSNGLDGSDLAAFTQIVHKAEGRPNGVPVLGMHTHTHSAWSDRLSRNRGQSWLKINWRQSQRCSHSCRGCAGLMSVSNADPARFLQQLQMQRQLQHVAAFNVVACNSKCFTFAATLRTLLHALVFWNVCYAAHKKRTTQKNANICSQSCGGGERKGCG